MKSIIITPIFPAGFSKASAVEFAKHLALQMRKLWKDAEGIFPQINARGFIIVATRDVEIEEREKNLHIIRENMQTVFTDNVLEEIRKNEIDKIYFELDGEPFETVGTKKSPKKKAGEKSDDENKTHESVNTTTESHHSVTAH